MGIKEHSEDMILVKLPKEPDIGDDLKIVLQMVRDRGNFDVVIDFSGVDIVTSSSLSKMLKLRKRLTDCGHLIILCSMAKETKGNYFVNTGLVEHFEFAEDKDAAIAKIQNPH